jgi:DNA-binding beta-propeller fold protein YncE
MAREKTKQHSEQQRAEIVREYGPYPAGERVHGVTYDGTDVWYAAGDRLQSFEPASGRPGRTLKVQADAGTAFDGEHLFQLSGGSIQKVDPHTGAVVSTIPSPAGQDSAGLTWAEGSLWVAHHRGRKITQIDPNTGSVLRTLESTRFVTGVTFVEGDLWHATLENDHSELRRISPESGEVLETLQMPDGALVTGLESDNRDLFYCGGGTSGKIRAVRRPKRG